jgi:hypothetical protein
MLRRVINPQVSSSREPLLSLVEDGLKIRGACDTREAATVDNWLMGQFKCGRWSQCAAIRADEWHIPDISPRIALDKGGNTADQEAE